MTKYLTEERFIVSSNDPEAQKRYADGWERTFGEKKEETLNIAPESAYQVNVNAALTPGKPVPWTCGHCGATGLGGVHGCEGLGRYVVDFDSWTNNE